MSHSEITFGGILQPLVESLEKNPRQSGRLSGQEVVIPRKGIKAIIAVDGENDIHLLITPAPDNDKNLSKLDLRGLKVANRDWAVSGNKAQEYLDISCSTGILPSFKRPFLRFAEDVLFEISTSEQFPAEAVYRTGIRWRKFWSPDIETEISREWVHGLFGELLFLADIIERFGPEVVNSWTGPTGKDHDFQTGNNLAVEIKTSVETPFRINCNIRQLDHTIFKTLYIVCYHLASSEKGTALSDLVRNIEKLIGTDESSLDKFYERLMAAGYTRQLESAYNSFRLNFSDASAFLIDNNFPKITESSFVSPPDHRITGIRYSLQLTGLPDLRIDEIENNLRQFTKHDSK